MVEDILAAVKGRVQRRARRPTRRRRPRAPVGPRRGGSRGGGFVIDRPDYSNKTIKELREMICLVGTGTAKSNAPAEAEHAFCLGHAAYITVDA